jgi:hypothetical protein
MQTFKKLPIGIQDFDKLREQGFVYVDKTEKIYHLLMGGGYYFLSRPRRFGKSLLLSTLKQLFLGNKHLFKGLWIEDKIEWKSYPVIHLSFGGGDFKEIGLRNAISMKLKEVAEQYHITLTHTNIANQFQELIVKLSEQGQVVILIDEYDKPIIEYLGKDEIPQALENRDILKEFYSIIKDLDAHIHFFFLTGVSKFSKVSIFSELNHLDDLTIDERFGDLLGYTEAEVQHYFKEEIVAIAQKYKTSEPEILNKIRAWYDGYLWAGEERLYNPFSLLNFMQKRNFYNFWFESGTPTFLIKLLSEKGIYDMDNTQIDLLSLGSFKVDNINVTTVLFQTGYLTFKEIIYGNIAVLKYPNQEVKEAMTRILLVEYAHTDDGVAGPTVIRIKQAFDDHHIDEVMTHLNTLFAKIPYQIFEERLESFYQSIIFLTFTLLGYYAQAEVMTSKGRIDVVVQTQAHIYILEFKVQHTALEALQQIKDKQYAQKYKSEGKPIYLVGIGCQQKEIKDYLMEECA